MDSFASPSGNATRRVTFSGEKRQRSDSIIDESTEATTRSSADIIEDFEKLNFEYAAGLICTCEEAYFDSLTACNIDLEKQRVTLSAALQRALRSTTTGLERFVVTTFDKTLHDANEKLEQEVEVLRSRHEALRVRSQEDSNNERNRLTTKELDEKTKINELLTKEFDKTKSQFDETKSQFDKTTTEFDEMKSQFDETMLEIDEITMDRNLLMERLNEQSDETNKLLAEHYATINLLTEDCDETKKVVESQRNELELQSALPAKREATIIILTNER